MQEARIQPLPFDAAALRGLSQRLVDSHHQNNYGGAVKRLNAIRARLDAGLPDLAPFELNGLKREELVAANSMLLHELYFDSLGGDGTPMPPPLAVALAASFGSVERWQAEFTAMGRALAGGSGWVLLVYSPAQGRLFNQWAGDHTQAMAGALPVLALDMYEHAYHLDFGARAADYVDAFMANIAWAGVHRRYQHAVHGAAEPFAVAAGDLGDAVLLDVRRDQAFRQSPDLLPGARWADPAAIGGWASELDPAREVVVYCVAGHEMSRGAALRLRAQGVHARFLEGGIDAWKAQGRATESKPPA